MPESYWCKAAPNVPRVWSASSLACIADCPRRFELRYIEGWVPKGENLDFAFGTAVHDGLQTYWSLRILLGMDKDEALNWAISVAWQTDLPAPRRPSQTWKTKWGVARVLVAYVDDYDDDPSSVLEHDGEPALEVHFQFLLPRVNPDGEPYMVQGYIDALRKFGGLYTCWDYKTTGRPLTDYYFQKYEINVQNYVYSMASKILTGEAAVNFLIDGLSINPYGDPDTGRKPIELTLGEVEEGLQDIMEYIALAERYAERGYYPKNTSACSFCDFNKVCNKDPKTRIFVLKSDFDEKRRTEVG